MAKRRTTTRRTTAPAGRRRRFWNYPRSHVRGFRRWLPSWRVVVGSFLLLVGTVVGVGAMAYYTTKVPGALPSVGQEKSTVYWADGSVMVEWAAEDRTIIDYGTLPQCDGQPQSTSTANGVDESCLGNAVVASEDRTFWTNAGVDAKGTLRALVNNLKGGARQGGSTITQQYVERYYEDTTTSYTGKAREAILALKISQAQDKEEILGNYLNTIYFGRGAYGIEAAAMAYFGVPAAQLDYNQSAFIAGIIPSPNRYTTSENGPAWAQERWQRTINFMAEDGYITAEQKAAAAFPRACTAEESAAGPCPAGTVIPPKVENSNAGPTGYLIQMVKEELLKQDFTEGQLYGDGLQITTTFDPAMQQAAVDTIQGVYTQEPAPNPNLHGTLVSIDPKTGAIKALYGGPDYVASQFNYAVQGTAQPGSTFKPFTLIAALEDGHSLNETFDGNSGLFFKSWNKKVVNFGGQSFGSDVSLLKATAFSVNTVYAALNDEIKPESTTLAAYHAGIKMGQPGLTDDEVVALGNDFDKSNVLHNNPANVLGTDQVRPVELANAYATIAANGSYTPYHAVQSVTTKDGTVRFDAATAYPAQAGAIDPEAAAGATHAMQQVVDMKGASGNPAQKLDRPVAGKTGTSSDNVTAWFAGFTPQLVTVVGLSQSPDDGSPGNVPITPFGEWKNKEITGGSWPVKAWTSYMTTALAGQEVEDFAPYKPKDPLPSESPSEMPEETLPPEEPAPESTPEANNIQVPAVANQSRDAALAALKGLGFAVQETREYSDTVPAGSVIRTVPDAGTMLAQGQTVSVVVSDGQRPTQPTPSPTPTPSAPAAGP